MVGSVRSKWEVGVFKCEICEKIFYKRESLFSHLADVHRTSCFLCKWIFESKPDLIIHNLVCHDTSFYICGRENCLLQFKSEEELGTHLEEKHVNFVKQKLSCDICGGRFTKAKSLLKHKINDHKVGEVYMCSQCQFCSHSVEGLMEHERREQTHNHPPVTLPSTKPHIILDGNPIIPCNKCKTKFSLGTELLKHMRLKHRDVFYNKGSCDWKCSECEKEFKQEISLKHHFIAKHKPSKELDDKITVVKEEAAMLEIEIKIEIKPEPTDENEYFENMLEMTDLKTEAICNKDEFDEPVCNLADTDYNIKQEESVLKEADYDIKVEESDEQIVVKDFKKENSEVIFSKISNPEVNEVEVGLDRKSGMIRVHLPAKFNNMQDDFIKDFFEVSYGKIIKFARCKKVTRTQKKKGFRNFCLITFEDEKASMFLDKQGHVVLDGCKLKTVACEHPEEEKKAKKKKNSEEKKSLQRPPPSGTNAILLQKIYGTLPQSINSLLLDLKVRTSMPPKEESDNDSISSMEVECHSCVLCKSRRHADNLQVLRSRTMQRVRSRSKKKNKKAKHPLMAQIQVIHSLNTSQHQFIPAPKVNARPPPQVSGIPPLQVPARLPPQVHVIPPPQVTARPHPQVPGIPPPQVTGIPPPQVPGITPPQVHGIPPPQVHGIPPPQVPARLPPQVHVIPPPQVTARPPLQVPGIPPPQVHGIPPPQVPASLPPQVPARPPLQYSAMSSSSYYSRQNQPYMWSWGQAGHGYYPPQFGSAPWSGGRTQLGRPYCYFDNNGKLVQRRGVNARMWPY